jgi:hypothetical protein
MIGPRGGAVTGLVMVLHVLTMWVLAVAHPLFAVLANSPHFFVAHRSTPGDILLFVLLVTLIAPAPLILITALAQRVGMPRLAPAAAVAVLVAVLVLPMVGPAPWLPAPVIFALAALAGAATGALYVRRSAGIRLFVTCLSPALIVVPGVFLFGSDVSRLLRPPSPDTMVLAKEAAPVPVVLVVFDELPLVSLLDEDWAIDRRLFPNLAAFSSEATWFRNATTVAEGTVHAIPAILSGRYPERNRLPTARDHPGTLFTLLAESHDVHASEAGTQLCPPHVCTGDGDGRSRGARMSSLAADATVVLLHIVLPPALRAHLPPVGNTWSGFWVAGSPENDEEDHKATFNHFHRAITGDRVRTFEQFIDDVGRAGGPRPRFEYLHTMLVHLPWLQLASGHEYDRRQQIDGRLPDEIWGPDQQIVTEAQYRHLQAAANADRLLGMLFERLRQVGVYDDTLIVVTADHGGCFRAGEPRRNLSATNLGEIATVPLLMKRPGQQRGDIRDEPVETIDIAPTVAEVLDVSIPWPVDGRSLSAPPETRSRVIYTIDYRQFPVSERLDELIAEPLRARVSLPRHSDYGPLWPGPDVELVGARATALEADTRPSLAVRIHDSYLLKNVDPQARFVPALQRGLVEGLAPDAPAPRLALALNGTVAATTWGRWNGQGHEFSAVVPLSLLRAGDNALDVFLVTPDPSRLLQRLPEGFRTRYRLVRSGAGEAIVDGDGRRYAVRPGAVQGWVDVWETLDSTTSRAAGWAVDPAVLRPADAVVAFLDGELAGLAFMRQSRPDVAQLFGRPDTDPSGFVLDLAVRADEGLLGSELRIFALSDQGYATELANPVEGVALGLRRQPSS